MTNFDDKLIRLLVNEILINEGGLDGAGGSKRRSPGLPFTAYHDISFGPWQGFKKYPGPYGYLVFKLTSENGKNNMSYAQSLGAFPVPDSYLVPGNPFYDKLKELSDEAFRRNILIAKAKNDAELEKTLPFNNTRSFYVAISSTNPNLVDQYARDADKEFNEETLLGLMLNDPTKGYGKFIKKLPPLERNHFIAFLTQLAALSSAVSTSSAVAGWASKNPVLKKASGVFGALSIGPYLALSSIAAEEGDSLTAAIYLLVAATTGWAAYSDITGSFVAAIKSAAPAGLAKPGMQALFEGIGGSGKVSIIDNFIDFLRISQERFSQITNFGWKQLPNGLWEASISGKTYNFTTLEKEFFQEFVKSGTIVDFTTKLSNIWNTIKSAIMLALGTYGFQADLMDIIKTVETTPTTKNIVSKPNASEIRNWADTKIIDLHRAMNNLVPTGKFTDFYSKISNTEKTVILDSSNFSRSKLVSKQKLQDQDADIVIVPPDYFNVYEQLMTFPRSLSNPERNIIVKDKSEPTKKVFFIFKASEVTG
jgi:hypothetical protein